MLNKTISSILPYMPKKLVWTFSKRYVAGETAASGVAAVKELNTQGAGATIDLLGEFITDLNQAEANKKNYLTLINYFLDQQVQTNFSLKPTMFGLLLDKNSCFQHLREIIKAAALQNNFIRIDMEDSQCVDDEIDFFMRLKDEFPGHVGLVMQSYLRRTLNDLQTMVRQSKDPQALNFRLCKGIYVEPASIAFKDAQEIREHYLENLEFLLKNHIHTGIATHDKLIVDGAFQLIEKYKAPKSNYEFQMLYGVTPDLRKSIIAKGHAMRVYVPYGEDWFGYCTRRLKENPQMTSHIIKAFFKHG